MLARAEELNAARCWRRDPYAAAEALARKRASRGWDGGERVKAWVDGLRAGGGTEGEGWRVRGGGEGEGCGMAMGEKDWEGVRGLLEWKGGESGVEIYPGLLPWN